ncbi:MAG TPA: hypothetical protein VER79_13740 [Candidatus Limnocylindrales bacterium]|nr:hypothetical protein [Candidatus Limnocylindrales bacterium]
MSSSRRGCLGCFGIFIAMLVCGSTVFLAVDRVCYAGLTQRVPVYPEAATISLQHNMLFAWGMGTTVGIFESADDPETVRRWYANNLRAFTQNVATSSSPMLQAQVRLTQARWDVGEAESGVGSQIILFGQCAN